MTPASWTPATVSPVVAGTTPPSGRERSLENRADEKSRPDGARHPRVVGLDLSLTSAGVATDAGTFTIASKANGDERLLDIRDRVHDAAVGADLAVIEDLPTHAKSAGITGRVQGVVRVTLMDAKVPYVLVVPSVLKKYATDNGNADKVAMAVAALKRFGMEFRTSDECDAYWLRAMALDALGYPLAEMPKAQRALLNKVTWPEIGGAS